MQLLEHEIKAYVEMIWDTMLGLPVSPAAPDAPLEPGFTRASIQITGEWKGVVYLDIPEALAHRITQILFQEQEGRDTTQEMFDALAETANLVGGNLKSLLPQPSLLMLPIVSLEGDALLFPNTRPATRLNFQSEGSCFRVTLAEYQAGRFARNWADKIKMAGKPPA